MGLHKDVAEDNMHEPKGTTTLTGGASDIGKVIVSKGDGTTETRKLTLAELNSAEAQYGTITISDNATVLSLTIAVDLTLLDNADYTAVTGIWDTVPTGVLNGITQQTNSFTVTTTGDYEIHFWTDTSSSVNSTAIAFKFAVNGTILLGRRPKNFLRNVGEFHNLSAHGFVNLTAGDIVTLVIASNKTADITLQDAVLSLNLLRRT